MQEAVNIKTNIVFERLKENFYLPNKKVFIFQGGTRSGKTYNILLWLIFIAIKFERDEVFTICRGTLPALKATALRDFIEILQQMNLYHESFHNKTANEYTLNGNLFEFFSVDQPEKVRGRKRKYLFCNEVNETDFHTWVQLLIRTTGKVIIDFNPSMPDDHYVFSELMSRDDHYYCQTTYRDNPFLDQTTVKEIERLQAIDANLWRVYGMGERGRIEGVVFTNWKQIPPDSFPSGKQTWHGLDFGFTHDPSALVEVTTSGGEIFVRELLYRTGLTNREISEHFAASGIRKNTDEIYADSAEPKSIHELRQYGYNVYGADKGADSIMKSIDLLKQYRINVTQDSVNLIRELQNYKWQQDRATGKYINKPIDAYNHLIDALRYACVMKLNRRTFGMTRAN